MSSDSQDQSNSSFILVDVDDDDESKVGSVFCVTSFGGLHLPLLDISES